LNPYDWGVTDNSGVECLIDDDWADSEAATFLGGLQVGSTLASITGIFNFSYGAYKIQIRNIDDFLPNEEEAIIANFSSDLTGGEAPLTIQFIDQSTAIGTSINSWQWDFDNDSIFDDIEQNPTWIYEEEGIYSVTLTVSDDSLSSTITKDDYIIVIVESDTIEYSPQITDISDVPDDQGGKVFVQFTKAYFDDTSPNRTEAYYVQLYENGFWTTVGSTPALNDSIYQVLALTLVDSTADNNGMTEFRVVASMDEGTWISESDWGYSVDNIVPAIPTNLLLSYSDDMVLLTWDPPVDEDFQYFSVYRNGELADYTVEPEFEEIQSGAEYYVTATDANGNESEPSETASGYSVDVVNLSGWNLVGLPLEVDDASYGMLFADAIDGTLYGFNGAYYSSEILEIGNGYWLNFPYAGSTTISGISITNLTVSLSEGWNLITGISSEVAVEAIGDPNGIIVSGTIYGYSGSYYSAEAIEPGKGYWINASADGEITLSSTALVTKTVAQINHLEGSNTLELSNGTDSSTLYFGKDVAEEHRNSYSLPPTFPQMAFDARFNGDMKYTMVSGDILVLNTSDNLTISYDIIIDAGEHMNWVLTSESGKDYTLEGTGEITVPTEETFTLERKAILPIAYTLHQNYPNPFNPITSLRYDLPEQAQVTLTVYDLMGREVTQLVNTTQDAGYRSVQWNATDSFGKPVSAGVYLYQIRAGEFVQTRKMVLLK
jgi:PKD repeat protein